MKNNALSGSIPESLVQLNQLVYLDLSNNQLIGDFPEWVRRLKALKLLNLGQNDFSGNIPSAFRIEHNDGFRFLNNMPLVMRELQLPSRNGRSLPYRDRLKPLMIKLYRFVKENDALKNIQQNMLWVDAGNIDYQLVLQFEKVMDEYIQAEDLHLFSKSFQILRNYNNGHLSRLFQNGYMLKQIGPN